MGVEEDQEVVGVRTDPGRGVLGQVGDADRDGARWLDESVTALSAEPIEASPDVAAAFNARLIKKLKVQRGVREYLQEDYE